jgi:hypothetical protein
MSQQTEYLFRAAYEYPKSHKRGRITFVATRDRALKWAAGYVKYFCKGGYLLSIVEDSPVQINLELI